MKRLPLIIAVIALYLLHQDFWFWRAAKPLILGFLPVGLFYHVVYTLVISALMWLLVRGAWPSHLEERAGEWESGRAGEHESITPSPLHPFTPSPKSEEALRQ
jgi:hypothetical protein